MTYYVIESLEGNNVGIETEWDCNSQDAYGSYILLGRLEKFTEAKQVALAYAIMKRRTWS